jgi:putative drug exporter of the RND superfamily
MSLARASRRRSWRTLIVWGFAVVALAALGSGIEGRLSPMSLEVPGTPSSRAEAMLRAQFGNTIPIAILLRGPAARVDAEGRGLVRALRAQRAIQVLSPWDSASAMTPATMGSLRPRPGEAFVLVDYVRPDDQALAVVPATERILASTVRAPVRSYLTGVAVIGRAIQQSTLADTARAEKIALPILVLVLLLVFRSPVAAAVPLAMGGATVAAGHGLLWLASFLTPINSLGVAIAAMMSLALGVDYALLMVSRVRQELAGGAEHEAAIAIAARAAGRTIVAAGGTLALTMLAASAVATPGLLGPVAIGVVISGLLSVALAVTAMPALLRLLGSSLNRWELRLPAGRARRRRGVAALAERLIAHPAVVVPLILAVMFALAAPAGALRLGPPDAGELPASSPARQAVAMVQRTIGPGWSAPFVVVANAGNGAITTPARLRALIAWQERVARDSGVAAVLGPASVAGAKVKLAEAHAALVSAPQRLQGAQRGIGGLRSGLGRASAGVARLRDGLGAAASGARSLAGGDAQAQAGARRLAREGGRAQRGAGLLAREGGRAQRGARRLAREGGRAHGGAQRLAREARRAGSGARRLRAGAGQAGEGAQRLAAGLDEASAGAGRLASSDSQLTSGTAQLAQTADGADEALHALLAQVQARTHLQLPPRALEAIACLDGLRAKVDRLATGARESEEGAAALHAGLERLAAGGHSLGDGLTGLSAGAGALSDGLDRLSAGDRRLAGGLGALSAGDRRLAGGLGRLSAGEQRLAGGLGGLSAGDRQLADGLGALGAGNERLAGGLSAADARSGSLAAGLASARKPLRVYAQMLAGYRRDYALLHAGAPRALDSGYLVLTALDGTVAPVREQVAQMIDVDGGGQTARMMVVSASAPGAPATAALSKRLRASLPALAAATGASVQIGQGAQYLLDYKNANTARVPWLVLALALVATLTLIVVLRALLLPLLAVALNLATIAVAIGALQLLTEQGVLGGPGYIDAASGAGILAIMFVLSIDYEVFLLTRMRERWLSRREHRDAIAYGLRHTAGVITGSAAIMTAVFAAFAGADVIPLRQFGVGLTIAVVLDATIVRLVLLPAAMRLAGPRVWWLPGWLERRLPALGH